MSQVNYSEAQHIPEQTELEKTFLELAEQWRKETGLLSSPTKMSKHPAYQKIIRMGGAVVPLILRELEREPEHWFLALIAIAGQNPVSREDNFEQAVEAWLRWGRGEGLI